jgi:hypothetical protein
VHRRVGKTGTDRGVRIDGRSGAEPESTHDADRGPTVVGLVCEPHGEPVGVTARLAEDLRGRLAGAGRAEFDVVVHHERLPLTEDTRNADLLHHLHELRRRNGWDLTLCIVRGQPRICGAHPAPRKFTKELSAWHETWHELQRIPATAGAGEDQTATAVSLRGPGQRGAPSS